MSPPLSLPFPYAVSDPLSAPAHPDRLLLWLARKQWRTLLGGVLTGVPWMLSLALVPAAIGQAIDRGIVPRDGRQLLLWSGAVLALGLATAVFTNLRHWFAVRAWLFSSFRSGIVADAAVRRAGPALTREVPAGEVVTVFAADFGRMGHVFDVSARFSGALVSFLVVALILLSGSTQLGLVMLLGGPLLVAVLPLIARSLQRRQNEQRSQMGALTALGTDTVAGLRILRGIGGEQVFLGRYREQSERVRIAGVRVASVQAGLDSMQVLLPGLFVLLITGLGAHLALGGQIAPGQLVAYFGYTTFLTMPLRTAVEFVQKLIRTRVAAARIVRLMQVRPDQHDDPTLATAPGPTTGPGRLTDPASGLDVAPGTLVGIVSARPEASAALAARLGRTGPERSDVRLDGVPLDDLPLAEVRRRILVSDAAPRLFSGTVREALTTGMPRSPAALDAAIHTAQLPDVLDTLDEGLDGEITEGGRSLSGGQRQRLVLGRALLRDPDVLVLIQPTSAVDAQTEARIAERLVEHRRGRTTVLTTASPIVLDRCDLVAFLADGTVVATGTHRDLVHGNAAYRDVVLRGEA